MGEHIESFLYGQVADFNETSEAQLEDSFIHILNLKIIKILHLFIYFL